jgi:H+-transporting ATPase
VTYQRILTYTLRSIIHKVMQVLFLTAGLMMTGQAVLTPMLMVLVLVIGDVLAMSTSTDNVRPSPHPSVWRMDKLSAVGVVMGLVNLVFCVSCLATGRYLLHLDIGVLRTMTVAILVLSGQAIIYVARERAHLWHSRPGRWVLVSSLVDLSIISTLSLNGILMAPLPPAILAGLLAAAIVFAFVLDMVKLTMFRWLAVDTFGKHPTRSF